MEIKKMTEKELIALKKDINKELMHRVQDKYDELENNIIKLITDFEIETGYYIAVDLDGYSDRAISFVKGCFYHTSEYIEPYE